VILLAACEHGSEDSAVDAESGSGSGAGGSTTTTSGVMGAESGAGGSNVSTGDGGSPVTVTVGPTTTGPVTTTAGEGGGPSTGEGGGQTGAGGAGGSTPFESPGTVEASGMPCIAGAGEGCTRLTVGCDGVPSMDVMLRVTEPTAPLRGTIVFGSGAGGTSFYGDAEGEGAGEGGQTVVASLFDALRADGFRLVERAWVRRAPGSAGWFEGGPSLVDATCRFATLMGHIDETIATSGALCAVANSGGSVELTYGMVFWNVDALLDFAIPTSGPVHRLDQACHGGPAWEDACPLAVESYLEACQPPSLQCQLAGGATALIDAASDGACSAPPSPEVDARLLADSLLGPASPGLLLETPLAFLYGGEDCSAPVAVGLTFAEAVRDAGNTVETIEIVPEAPHPLHTEQHGAARIAALIEAHCGEAAQR